jgi:NADH-quinone oxidoreductase subunit I
MAIENQNFDTPFGRLIKKVFFIDLIKGMTLTLQRNLSRSYTMRYPDEEKWVPYERFRGLHTLNRDEEGRELCVGCELCSRSCPTQCITVIPMEDDTGKGIADRIAKVWKVDLTRCMYCGLCEDACPTTALRMGRHYELACFTLEDAIKEKDELLAPQEIPEDFEGGVVAKAKFERDEKGIRVKLNLGKWKRWW